MRGLARRLLTLCTVVSLLLCVSASVLWVRSYSAADDVSWTPPSGGAVALGSWRGRSVRCVIVGRFERSREGFHYTNAGLGRRPHVLPEGPNDVPRRRL